MTEFFSLLKEKSQFEFFFTLIWNCQTGRAQVSSTSMMCNFKRVIYIRQIKINMKKKISSRLCFSIYLNAVYFSLTESRIGFSVFFKSCSPPAGHYFLILRYLLFWFFRLNRQFCSWWVYFCFTSFAASGLTSFMK